MSSSITLSSLVERWRTLKLEQIPVREGENGVFSLSIDGTFLLNGAGDPDSSLGAVNDFYINTTNYTIFGPKTEAGWGSATSLVGPEGASTIGNIASEDPYMTLKNTTDENTDGGAESRIIFEDHSDTALAHIKASHQGTLDDTKGQLILATNDGTSLTERMRINAEGNVGIGASNPSLALAIRDNNTGLEQTEDETLSIYTGGIERTRVKSDGVMNLNNSISLNNTNILSNYSECSFVQLGGNIVGEASYDDSGISVSLNSDGTIMAIGARYNDGGGSNAGHTRVYQFSAGSWTQLGDDIDGKNANENSGSSVSLNSDGTIVAIGTVDLLNTGYTSIYGYNGTSWVQLGTDIAGESSTDVSGWSVSLSADGSIVAIGAIYNDGNGSNSGHTRVYQYDGSSWVQLGSDIDGEAAGDQSGYSVSLSNDGSIVAIGAILNNGSGQFSGHVRVYQYIGTSWVQLGSDIDGESAGDRSGFSVSLNRDGTIVAIGANYAGDGSLAGHTRIYQYKNNKWTQLGQDIDGEAAGDESGNAVSLSADGTIVAIGARYNDGNGNNAGHVRIYQYIGTSWVQLGVDIDSFDIDGITTNSNAGYSVSLSDNGNILAIGAIGSAVKAGITRVYELGRSLELKSTADIIFETGTLTDGTLTEHMRIHSDGNIGLGGVTNPTLQLTIGDHDTGLEHLDNDTISIYTNGYERMSVKSDGVVNVNNSLSLNNNNILSNDDNCVFQQLGTDIDGEATADESGYSVSLNKDGTIVAIGARYNDGTGSNAGHVRVYQYDGASWAKLGQDIDGEATGDESGFSTALSSDGTIVAIGAPGNDDGAGTSGHIRVYQYDSDGNTWTQLGTDIDGLNGNATASGLSVALNGDGTIVAFGSPRDMDVAANEGTTKIYKYNGTDWVQLGETISGGGSTIWSGWSVALNTEGNIVAIGSRYFGGGVGYLRLYRYDGAKWVQLGADIYGEVAGDQAGYSASLSADGTIAAIGSILNDSKRGMVRVFKYDSINNSWGKLGENIVGEETTDESGISLSLSGDGTMIAIGANKNDGNGADSGHVRLYEYNGTSWTQLGADIDGEAASNYSGFSVSLSKDGTKVAIGAPYNSGDEYDTTTYGGHTRVYEIRRDLDIKSSSDIKFHTGKFIDGTLTERMRITADGQVAIKSDIPYLTFKNTNMAYDDRSTDTKIGVEDHLQATLGQIQISHEGESFDTKGNLVIAINDGTNGIKEYSLTQLGSTITGVGHRNEFGFSVALSKNGLRVAIGAPEEDDNGTSSGTTRIYEWDGTSWNQLGGDIIGEAEGDKSGNSVSLNTDGSIVAIGAFLNDDGGISAGHTRIYEWDGTSWNQLGDDIDGPGGSAQNGVSVSLNGDGNIVAISEPIDPFENNYGDTKIFQWNGTAWVQLGSDIRSLFRGNVNKVAMSKDGLRIIVNDDTYKSKIRMYEYDGSDWVQMGNDIQHIDPSIKTTTGSVSINSDGTRVAHSNYDIVKVYQWNGADWYQLGDSFTLTTGAGDVSLNGDGNYLAISEFASPNPNDITTGLVNIYKWNGRKWFKITETLYGTSNGDFYGKEVSLSEDGTRLAIGATQKNSSLGFVEIHEIESIFDTQTADQVKASVNQTLVERFCISSAGNVGIGTFNSQTTPSQPQTALHINKSTNDELLRLDNGNLNGSHTWDLAVKTDGLEFIHNGTYYKINNDNTITTSSDDRLKTNEEVITNATSSLMKLKPQTYNMTFKDGTTSEKVPGLIAQEVYYDAPELRMLVDIPSGVNPAESVNSSEDPTADPDYSSWGEQHAGLKYSGFIPYLIKSIQELKTTIDTQQTTIDALKSRIDVLENA